MEDYKQNLRILIIEDDDDHAFLESDILQDELECTITVAASKSEFDTIDLTRQDVVLLDFNLPDSTGDQLLRIIREQTDIPVIIITAQKDLKIAIETLKDGANDFLEKSPNNIKFLPSIVKKAYNLYLKSKKAQEQEREKEELDTKVETLRQVLTTLSHYINNSTTTISGYAQLALQFPNDLAKIEKFANISIKETKKITFVLKELERFVTTMEIQTTNYVDIPNAMFNIEENIQSKMREIENESGNRS
ncbi:MAG TPA: response regulator [Caldithrix abyssi]|uniref:Response regulator n=1 Tax=Caldithrix abyssi TaxID=187145 RepID=A0A7V5RP33_CALAY|nr:response regulator [Caldithrix abyssi]